MQTFNVFHSIRTAYFTYCWVQKIYTCTTSSFVPFFMLLDTVILVLISVLIRRHCTDIWIIAQLRLLRNWFWNENCFLDYLLFPARVALPTAMIGLAPEVSLFFKAWRRAWTKLSSKLFARLSGASLFSATDNNGHNNSRFRLGPWGATEVGILLMVASDVVSQTSCSLLHFQPVSEENSTEACFW